MNEFLKELTGLSLDEAREKVENRNLVPVERKYGTLFTLQTLEADEVELVYDDANVVVNALTQEVIDKQRSGV